MKAFTAFHVALSLIGIASGIVVVLGFLRRQSQPLWNSLFLWTTALTSLTGFFFPYHGVTPGIVVGAISLLVLAVAVYARRSGKTAIYIVTACFAEALNVVVLVVQSFGKIPALHQLAPTGKEPIVAAGQLGSLLLFMVLAWIGVRRAKES